MAQLSFPACCFGGVVSLVPSHTTFNFEVVVVRLVMHKMLGTWHPWGKGGSIQPGSAFGLRVDVLSSPKVVRHCFAGNGPRM